MTADSRCFGRVCIVLLLTASAVVCCGSWLAAAPPNFVFIITDDISPDDTSVYGNPIVRTPRLEALAQRGMVFDNAYLTISSCSPSRCSIITGRYPHNHGAPELHSPLPAEQVTFVQKLRDAGYYTVISGKNHMNKPRQLGFAKNSDSGPAGAEKWVKELQDRPRDQPFFCWFASHDAHYGFETTADAPVYAGADMPVPPMLYDGVDTRAELAKHAHEVSRADFFLGKVIDELDRQQVLGQTYVVFCADNGRPFPRCKTFLYDSGIKTPLVIAGPDVAKGRTSALLSSVDLSATFLELAGIEKPASVQGVSQVPVLHDPQASVREVAFAERNWHVFQNHQRAVRWDNWLYIWNAWPERYALSGESSSYVFPAAEELWHAGEAGKLTPAQSLLTESRQPVDMLFDVTSDPYQLTNLAADDSYADQLALGRDLLQRWQRATGDSVPTNPTKDRQTLHEKIERNHVSGEFAGAANNATAVNSPGPVRLSASTGQ